jgi:hypothetical protein
MTYFPSNKLYEIEEARVQGPNIITFMVVSGGDRYYAVGCYIPPNNLKTLTHIKAAWNKCPKGQIPVLLGDLNIKLASPRNEHDELIAEQVGDVMGLVDVSCQFKQCRQVRAQGRWTWRMRQGGRWVSSQCDYFLGRETDHRRIRSIGLRIPSHHDSDHCAIVAKIYSGSEKKMKAYQRQRHHFPIKLPRGPQGELETLFEELCSEFSPPWSGKDPQINGFLTAHGCLSIVGQR